MLYFIFYFLQIFLDKKDELSINDKNYDVNNDLKQPILIKSDKIKFVGKQTKLPVSSFSRALNFGVLGASILTNTLGNVLIDKVFFLFNYYLKIRLH